VVDDNRTNRLILDEMLRHWGMAPTSLPSARQALDCMRQAFREGSPFPLVLTDCSMPEMDGFSFVEQLRHDSQLASTAIVMLTSGTRAADFERCDKLGVVAHIMKPVKQSELIDAIGKALDTRAAEPQPEPFSERDRLPQIRPLRILLAEDSLVNQKLAVGLLKKYGHTVTVANTGRKAVEAWEEQPFDLVLMDVQMPEMDGLEATAIIRQREEPRGRHTPIVAMTAHALKGDRERCLEAGMDGYTSKPIRVHELFAVLERLFGVDD
jgi:CheY-like chemotaxis protein